MTIIVNDRKRNSINRTIVSWIIVVAGVVTGSGWDAAAQQTPEQAHLSHHPELQQGKGQESHSGDNQFPGAMGKIDGGMDDSTKAMGKMDSVAKDKKMGGMKEEMGEMMKEMNLPKPKELYPSLMAYPDLPTEKRAELEATAHQRMETSMQLLSESLDRLRREAAIDDFSAMQKSVTQTKESLAQFESALAAQRVLAEGQSPRNVALQWFKQEMNLDNSTDQHSSNAFEFSLFHLSLMSILIVFAAVMIGMYFFKMRRATLLLQDVLGNTALAKAEHTTEPNPEQNLAMPLSERNKKWSGKLQVSRIFKETPDVRTFRLMNPLGGMLPFSYLPGQFLSITVSANGQIEKRSYTIASSPTQGDYAEITVKHKEGTGVSDVLFNQTKEGDLLDFSGPSGSFTFTGQECKCILLIGGGVGITPLMSVLRYLTDRSWKGDIYLLYGNKTPKDIIFKEEIEYLMRRHSNVHIVFTVSQPEGTDWKGPTGHINKELIAQSIPDIASRYVHICGPVPMMEAVKKFLAELGVPKDRIKIEAFGPALGKPEPVSSPSDVGLKKIVPGNAMSTVRFTLSNKSAPLPPDKSILDVADEIGVEIDNSCRAGTCGLCKVKLCSGQVSMAIEDALTPEDKAQGYVLACQAKATGNIEVEV